MSLLLRGKTVCHLCGEVIGLDDAAQQFPPGLFDSGGPVAHLNDSSIHSTCLDALPEAAYVRVLLDDYVRGRDGELPRRRFTAVVTTDGASERVTLVAVYRYEAMALLRETYGENSVVDLTDVEAAHRPR
ncbi:hypothetical protein [Nocardioides marmorisolisilvae]|uniref:Uncharacterized protein n=1 Tax=Nocardioides marmorisolisilvae TaxID=1542737 RepID=A0A3N0DW57_9ACTN|nr:hypothetical protein [Nocardioides marmorisolisilvae]RNL79825.1 hypothetical protein EFL95_12825 [Nocardioides marmorisolisilvae]